MAVCELWVHGVGATRLLSELVGMLTQRRVELVSINAAIDDAGCFRAQLRVKVADEAAVELLHKRLNRIVGVVKVKQCAPPAPSAVAALAG